MRKLLSSIVLSTFLTIGCASQKSPFYQKNELLFALNGPPEIRESYIIYSFKWHTFINKTNPQIPRTIKKKDLEAHLFNMLEEQEQFAIALDISKELGNNSLAKKFALKVAKQAEQQSEFEKAIKYYRQAGDDIRALIISFKHLKNNGQVSDLFFWVSRDREMDRLSNSKIPFRGYLTPKDYNDIRIEIAQSCASQGAPDLAAYLFEKGGIMNEGDPALSSQYYKLAMKSYESMNTPEGFEKAGDVARSRLMDLKIAKKNYTLAIELYIQQKEWLKAAHVAADLDDHTLTKQLWEKSKQYSKAAIRANVLGDYGEELRLLRLKIKSKKRVPPKIYFRAGRAAQNTGDDESAIKFFLKAKKYSKVAQILKDNGAILGALHYYEKANKNGVAAKLAEYNGLHLRAFEDYVIDGNNKQKISELGEMLGRQTIDEKDFKSAARYFEYAADARKEIYVKRV